MSQEVQKKRFSIITDIIIFLTLTLITVVVLKEINFTSFTDKNNYETSSLVSSSIESIADENNLYISKIKKEYGIKVEYGNKVKSFSDKVDATVQEDNYIINNNLKILYDALTKYPIQVFEKIANKEYPFYIIIVDKFQNDNIALASRNNLDEFRIYICNAQNFERAFHHEMYHIIEYYMKDKNEKIYIDWNKLNPDSFIYESNTDKLTKENVYDNNSYDNQNTYFVTKYSKSNEKEDRAEIFAEIMTMTKKLKYLSNGENIRKKVDNIINTINKNISPIDDFYFARFIY